MNSKQQLIKRLLDHGIKIPIGLKWVAQDSDGRVFAYVNKPILANGAFCSHGYFRLISELIPGVSDWKESTFHVDEYVPTVQSNVGSLDHYLQMRKHYVKLLKDCSEIIATNDKSPLGFYRSQIIDAVDNINELNVIIARRSQEHGVKIEFE